MFSVDETVIDTLNAVFVSRNTDHPFHLAVTDDGKLVAKEMTLKDKIEQLLDIGPFATKKVQAKLQALKPDMLNNTTLMLKSGRDIQPLQEVINNVFSDQPLCAIDLYSGLLSDWMGWLEDDIKTHRINQLGLPASHDSGAYQVDFSTELSKSGLFWWANFAGRHLSFVASFIKEWTVTQNASVYMQLEAGIRSLDLRVAYDSDKGDFYINHSLACTPLNTVINDIKSFLENHPKEVVVINMKPGYATRHAILGHEDELLTYLYDELGDVLCERTAGDLFDESMTYGTMMDNNSRVLVLYSPEGCINQYDCIWPGHDQLEDWDDTDNLQQRMQYIDAMLQYTKANDSTYYRLSAALTPDAATIKADWMDLFRVHKEHGLKALAKEMQPEIPGIVVNPGFANFGCVAADQIAGTPFAMTVVTRLRGVNEMS